MVRTTMMATSRLVPKESMKPPAIEAAADLQGAKAQRGGRPEQGGEDRQDVDGAAEPALGRACPAAGRRSS